MYRSIHRSIYRAIIAIATAAWTSNTMASPCGAGLLKDRFPDYITGKGEDEFFKAARASAISELAVNLGGNITTTSLLTETLNGSSAKNTIRSNATISGSGIDDLEECTPTPELTRVVVGVKKTRVRDALLTKAKFRQEAAAGPLSAGKSAIMRGAHQKDLETWIYLGFSEADFPNLKFSVTPKEAIPIILEATDDIAAKTLGAVQSVLSNDGYVISGKGLKLTWSCQLNRGLAMGEAVAFEANCSLTGDIMPSVLVKGITVDSNIEDQAARLISRKVMGPNSRN